MEKFFRRLLTNFLIYGIIEGGSIILNKFLSSAAEKCGEEFGKRVGENLGYEYEKKYAKNKGKSLDSKDPGCPKKDEGLNVP
jgi:hypothetical protein